MKIKKINSDSEKNLITGMITSDHFLSEIISIFDRKLLQTPYSKIVSDWCIDYFKKYNKSPKNDIQEIFKLNKDKLGEDEEVIETFLHNLSERADQLEKFNDKFILDESEKYLAERKLLNLSEIIKASVISGNINEAEILVAKHNKTARPESKAVDVINDKQAIIQAIHEEQDVLFEVPGAVGSMIGPLCRGDFFAFLAPMKRGKTFWMEDFAIRGAMAGLKVLFVSMEMPKNPMLKRIYQYFLAAPRKDQDITIPYFTEEGDVKTRTVHKKAISSGMMLKKSKALNLMIKSGGLRLICYPAKSASVKTIKNEILMLSTYEGFYPDIVVVDYADILAPEPESPNEYRHKIDHTWVTLRGLAQEINGLVITASQSSRASFSKDIEESDIAEDIRKLAHVTHMVSLNQKKEEKEKNIMRVSVLASRNEDFTGAEAVVLYQYAIGKAILDSRDEKDTNIC